LTARYGQLINIIDDIKPATILEVGTWGGDRAIQMAEAALKHQQQVTYYGFDLFEDATAETDSAELNVKAHFTVDQVIAKLRAFQEKVGLDRFQAHLFKGNTRETLPTVMAPEHGVEIDFAFIDGGHSIETMRSDIEAVARAKVVVVDDYYKPDDQGRCPDTSKYGANAILHETPEKLFHAWKWLSVADPVKDGGLVMMCVRGWAPKAKLEIKTKNCVPDEEIQKNIAYTMSKATRFLEPCEPHDLRAVIVSAGPSIKDHWDDVERWLRDPGARVFCVKHSHDRLLERDLVPYGCLLLDPRSHVQDFIESPDPRVKYFTSSMVHPTTIDRLIEKNANYWVYHALVGAGEQELLKQHGKHMLIGGGSTAAARGMSVLHALGFRRFTCIAWDSCYWDKPENSDEKLPDGNPRYYKVNVNGRDFWSDGQLLAQAQDFDRLLKDGHFYDIDVVGDGMIPHIWKTMRTGMKNYVQTYEG
jgi:predicted O-methyltransferase YrrM